MRIRDNAERALGLTVRQLDAEGRNWEGCYPVIQDGRVVGVVDATDNMRPLAGRGGGVWREDMDYYLIDTHQQQAGQARSERKAAASRENGKLGGRPKQSRE
jgi:hypothetical protein